MGVSYNNTNKVFVNGQGFKSIKKGGGFIDIISKLTNKDTIENITAIAKNTKEIINRAKNKNVIEGKGISKLTPENKKLIKQILGHGFKKLT